MTKKCEYCSEDILIFDTGKGIHFKSSAESGAYRHRKYCSNACKQAHYRARALQRNIVTNERSIMPHLVEWARKNNLIK